MNKEDRYVIFDKTHSQYHVSAGGFSPNIRQAHVYSEYECRRRLVSLERKHGKNRFTFYVVGKSLALSSLIYK